MEHREALLAIDAGNTRIKWAVHDGNRWARPGAIATSGSARIGEAWAALPAIGRAIACNVAGADVERILREACSARGAKLTVIAARAEELGVVNGYRDPARLGPDRWAALVAAHAVGAGAKLVVNAGTALTIDALAADGHCPGRTSCAARSRRGRRACRSPPGTSARFRTPPRMRSRAARCRRASARSCAWATR
jgi:type III pantothenate kinase